MDNRSFIVILSFISILKISAISGQLLKDDSFAVLKLSLALIPTPQGWSIDNGTNYCSWAGLQCDIGKRVIGIYLSYKNLTGTLPSELAGLSRLRYLSLEGNRLSGPIPNLSNLRFLERVLGYNNFTRIPDGFFRRLISLEIFNVSHNLYMAPWSLPHALNHSAELEILDARSSNLFGEIPDVFSSLRNLQFLDMSDNDLTGTLPASFANSSIQNLFLSDQKSGLSGTIDVLSSMPELRRVWLRDNYFTGLIPDFSGCDKLFELDLSANQIKGIVPASLTSHPALLNVTLSYNFLQGPVPEFPSRMTAEFTGNNFCLNIIGLRCDPEVTSLLNISSDLGFPDKLAINWQGNDACGFFFMTCDTHNKIITVNFANQNFSGMISSEFGNLKYLRNLLLNDNNLIGPIPDSLTKLPDLNILEVSNNNLSGKVPDFPYSVAVISTGNSFLHLTNRPGIPGAPLPSSISKASRFVIAGIAVPFAILAAVLLFGLLKHNLRQMHIKSAESAMDEQKGVFISEMQDTSNHDCGNISISIELLRSVTSNFNESNVLGKGGSGVVYKGELGDGTCIAVKKMEATTMGAKEKNGFQAEIKVLTRVRHRHLVALLGFCINGNEKFLVYEYMPQGTLAQHLFEWRERQSLPLTWQQRVTVALDVARGVEYLHSLAQESFIHRDLKPSNILLGDDMRAKVADFGLVKQAPDHEKCSLETMVAGTFGYIAPEYAATGKVTRKVDVYAFGAILMEMITGKKEVDETVSDEGWMCMHLVTWFRAVLYSKEEILKVIDEALNPEEQEEETLCSINGVAELAGHCTSPEPHQRPDMGFVVNKLGSLLEQWKPPIHEEDEETSSGKIVHGNPNSQFLHAWLVDGDSSTTCNSIGT